MTPPTTLNVIDIHGGFTAIVPTRDYRTGKMTGPANTLWRPGTLLSNPVGRLESFEVDSFYQGNNDVTIAHYKVPGYRYIVAVWFDNPTGRRIA